MLNTITIMGRLTTDPILRRTQTGVAAASFTLACERDYAPQGGEKETDFINVVCWRSTAEFVDKYFSKGRMAVVSGRLQIRGWTDKEGNKRRSAEVVADNVYFGESKKSASSTPPLNGSTPSERMDRLMQFPNVKATGIDIPYEGEDESDPNALPF